MIFRLCFLLTALLSARFAAGQNTWSLEISSSVELRTLKLTNRAETDNKPLKGASISLYQGSTMLRQVQSDSRGDFAISVPPDGEFSIVISFPQCNSKKFFVSTKGVPENFDKEGWEPTFPIGGVIMAKPLPGISYDALKEPMARIYFKQKAKVFDDDEKYTDEVLAKLKRIKSEEDELISRFLEAVQAGDAALKKPDCPLAKSMYEKALQIIPGEQYPVAQLVKVGDCLKQQEETKRQEEVLKAQENERREKERDEEVRREAQALAEKRAKDAEQAEKARRTEEEARVRQEEARKEAQAKEEQEAKVEAAAQARQREEKKAGNETARPGKEDPKTSPVAKESSNARLPKTNAAGSAPAVGAGTEKKSENTEAAQNGYEDGSGGGGAVKAKKKRYRVPQVLGLTQFQQLIAEADSKFNEEKYAEAKTLYSRALKLKPGDAHAITRLEEINKREATPSR